MADIGCFKSEPPGDINYDNMQLESHRQCADKFIKDESEWSSVCNSEQNESVQSRVSDRDIIMLVSVGAHLVCVRCRIVFTTFIDIKGHYYDRCRSELQGNGDYNNSEQSKVHNNITQCNVDLQSDDDVVARSDLQGTESDSPDNILDPCSDYSDSEDDLAVTKPDKTYGRCQKPDSSLYTRYNRIQKLPSKCGTAPDNVDKHLLHEPRGNRSSQRHLLNTDDKWLDELLQPENKIKNVAGMTIKCRCRIFPKHIHNPAFVPKEAGLCMPQKFIDIAARTTASNLINVVRNYIHGLENSKVNVIYSMQSRKSELSGTTAASNLTCMVSNYIRGLGVSKSIVTFSMRRKKDHIPDDVVPLSKCMVAEKEETIINKKTIVDGSKMVRTYSRQSNEATASVTVVEVMNDILRRCSTLQLPQFEMTDNLQLTDGEPVVQPHCKQWKHTTKSKLPQDGKKSSSNINPTPKLPQDWKNYARSINPKPKLPQDGKQYVPSCFNRNTEGAMVQAYPCTICSYKGIDALHLGEHCKKKHMVSLDVGNLQPWMLPSETLLACDHPDCTFRSFNKANVKAHKTWIHGSDLYSCSFERCDFKTKNKHTILSHKRRHLPCGEKQKIVCYKCGKTLTKSALSKHMETHSTASLRHACDKCPFRTRQKSNLTIHYRMHTGEKPYLCTKCGYHTIYPGLIKNHKCINPYQSRAPVHNNRRHVSSVGGGDTVSIQTSQHVLRNAGRVPSSTVSRPTDIIYSDMLPTEVSLDDTTVLPKDVMTTGTSSEWTLPNVTLGMGASIADMLSEKQVADESAIVSNSTAPSLFSYTPYYQ